VPAEQLRRGWLEEAERRRRAAAPPDPDATST